MDFSLKKQKAFFLSDQTKRYEFRIKMLNKLLLAIKTYEPKITKALYLDLHKSEMESYATEIGYVYHSIKFHIKHLKKWMKTKKVKTPLFMFGSKSYMVREPLGTVLIIGPYNYPFQLIIEPLIGAISAGNTAVIKPSEYTTHTQNIIKEMFETYFDESYIKVITGDKEVTSDLLDLNFDYIFFTGSTNVGKIVYEKASKNLTPVTLELGGKSPTIVLKDANLKLAARRIVFAKFLNAGQTCIAPDYVYVEKEILNPFIEYLILELKKQYPKKEDMAHIVNERHHQRLLRLIDENKVCYRHTDANHKKYLSPVIMKDVTWHDPVMHEEIFGPILPILSFVKLTDIIHTLKEKPKPLALYLFTENKAKQKLVFHTLSFGNGSINDALMQVANPYLPFGGIGASGLSRYHGKYSFEAFSHLKTYTKKTTKFDIKLAYTPYDKKKSKIIKKIFKP